MTIKWPEIDQNDHRDQNKTKETIKLAKMMKSRLSLNRVLYFWGSFDITNYEGTFSNLKFIFSPITIPIFINTKIC